MLIYSLLSLFTPFPINIFYHIAAPKVPNYIKRNPPCSFFILCFTVSLTPSMKTPEFFSDFMILIISSISSLGTTKVIHFPAVPAPALFVAIAALPCIFFFFFG